MRTIGTKSIAYMKAQFVVILLVVLARDQEGEVDTLQKHHFQVVQFLRLNSSDLRVEAIETERIVEEFDCDHNACDNHAMNR